MHEHAVPLTLRFELYMRVSNIALDVEKGLMDLALDPDWLNNRQFYMCVSYIMHTRCR